MPRLVVPAALALAAALSAQTALFPLKDLKAGMHGTGRTVFNGNKIEDFAVEILGVLDNIGPKESLILARLSGGPLEHTGVMQGMSGSPVYIDGKLVGAVAMAFPFAKDPIAGIRPIEAMLRTSSAATPPPPAGSSVPGQRAALALDERDLTRRIPRPEPVMGGEARMNRPGIAKGNWRWRLQPSGINPNASRMLFDLAETFGRLAWQKEATDE